MIRFGKYVLLDRVAAGGMAEVYRAKMFGSSGFSKYFAVKRILPDLNEEQEFIDMFIDEAKILVNLSHPNIVQVYELGQIGKIHYISMEFIQGRPLAALVRRLKQLQRRLPLTASLHVAQQTTKGLGYAHGMRDSHSRPLGIVHRDISPQNVLVSWTGDVKIVDFGVAKAANKLTSSRAGQLKGKFAYMSPEQAAGNDVDHRTDIFAAGVVLWEMVANRRLFKADSDTGTLKMVERCEVPDIEEVAAPVPDGLGDVLRRALARDPDKRYGDGREMARDLSQVLHRTVHDYTGEELGAAMQEVFSEEIQEEAKMMQLYDERVANPPSTSTFDAHSTSGTLAPPAPVATRGSQPPPPPEVDHYAETETDRHPSSQYPVHTVTFDLPSVSSDPGMLMDDPHATTPGLVLARAGVAPEELISSPTGVGEVRRARGDLSVSTYRGKGQTRRKWILGGVALTLLAAGGVGAFLFSRDADDADSSGAVVPTAVPADPPEPGDEDLKGPTAAPVPPSAAPETGAAASGLAASASAFASDTADPAMDRPGKGRKKPRTGGPGSVRTARGAAPAGAPAAGLATLSIGSKPWGEVWIDGKRTGLSTPVKGMSVPAGIVVIEVVHPPTGARKTERITLSPGDNRSVIIKLDK